MGPESIKSPPTWAMPWIPGWAQKASNHHPLGLSPGSQDPGKTLLPLERECNPAHSGVPGQARAPSHAQDISQGLQHEVQGNPQQPKWTSKGMPSTLQWQTNGQQLAIHRIIETSYHRILSLGAGGRGRSPSDSPHPRRGSRAC